MWIVISLNASCPGELELRWHGSTCRSFPSKSHSRKTEPGSEQELSTWLGHPAMQSRLAWLGPVAKALAAAGSSATSTATLQQPFPLLPASAMLPKAKVMLPVSQEYCLCHIVSSKDLHAWAVWPRQGYLF